MSAQTGQQPSEAPLKQEELKPTALEAQYLEVVEHILAGIPVKSGGFDRLIFVDEQSGIEKVYKFTKIKKKGPQTPKTASGIWKKILTMGKETGNL